MAADDDDDRWSDAAPMLVGSEWLIARSINSIYLREEQVPLTAAETVIKCLIVYVSALDQWGVNKIKGGKESQQDKCDNPSKA